MAVYFKFNSWNQANFDTIQLDPVSPFISVGELKQSIAKKKKIDKNNGLVITNAQTNEEYKDDTHLIQKNTSVVVRLVPVFNQNAQNFSAGKLARGMTTSGVTVGNASVSTTKKPDGVDDDFGPALWEDLSAGSAAIPGPSVPLSEEDKIKAIINQAADIPVSGGASGSVPLSGYGRGRGAATVTPPGMPKKLPPPGYVCYRCNQPGHFIYECPTNGDPSFNFQRKPPTMHGVPKSFLQESSDGKALEFRPNEHVFEKLISVSGRTKDAPKQETIPKELICPLCKNMLNNAVLIPCCMESACDDCIRTALIEKSNFTCPLCNRAVSPDELLPNKAVRRAVESFRSGKPQNEAESSTGGGNDVSSSSNLSDFKVIDDNGISNSIKTPSPPHTENISKQLSPVNQDNQVTVVEVDPTKSDDVKSVPSNLTSTPTEQDTASQDKKKPKQTGPKSKGKGDTRGMPADVYATYQYDPYAMMYASAFYPGFNPAMMGYTMVTPEEYEEQEKMRREYERRHRRKSSRSRSRSRSPRRRRSRRSRSRSRSRTRSRSRSPRRRHRSRSRERRKRSSSRDLESDKSKKYKDSKDSESSKHTEKTEKSSESKKESSSKKEDSKSSSRKRSSSKEKDKDKERDRERDKEKDRDKDRESSKDKEKEKEKKSDESREKERSSDRDRDRERSSDKDRDKERDKDRRSSSSRSSKDRDRERSSSRSSSSSKRDDSSRASSSSSSSSKRHKSDSHKH